MPDRRELTLYPYLIDRTCWVFDDERTGLREEAFVLGASEMITRVVQHKQLPDAERGFALTFSDEPLDTHDVELDWLRSEWGGNWYAGDVAGERLEAWLCPALFLYFQSAPTRIFVRCGPLPAGVTPIWSPADGITTRQFVAPPTASQSR
jgi:hypothetical protein